MLLETFGERPKTLVVPRRIIPESPVSRVCHYMNLSMGHTGLVLVDSGWFHNRILRPMRDQHRLADAGQEVIVVEGAENIP